MAEDICSDSLKTSNALRKAGKDSLSDLLFQAYLPRVPSTKRDGARDLAQYCIAVGTLFRLWFNQTKGEETYLGSTEIVEEAIRKREEKLQSLKAHERKHIEGIIKREGYMMKTLSSKIAKQTGCP